MVGHRSTGLPECGSTESSAPNLVLFIFNFLQSQESSLDLSSGQAIEAVSDFLAKGLFSHAPSMKPRPQG